MVKSKKNEIRKLQTKLELNIKTIPTDNKSFLEKKCFKMLFKGGEAATCSYSQWKRVP